MKPLSKRLVLVLSFCVIAILLFFLVRPKFVGQAEGSSQSFIKVKASRADLTVSVSSTGTVTSSSFHTIANTYSGIINQLPVRVGDFVAQGALIAQVGSTNYTSPVGGVVTQINFNSGETIQREKVLAVIADTSQLQVTITVDELDIMKLKPGQKASVALASLDGKTFEGEVLRISNLGKSVNNIATYDVTVSIKNPVDIKLGMTANVTVDIAGKKGALVLPVEAIQSSSDGKYVLMRGRSQTEKQNAEVPSAKTVSQRVETGLVNESYVEILSGVNEGDEVLIPLPDMGEASKSEKKLDLLKGTKNNKSTNPLKNKK